MVYARDKMLTCEHLNSHEGCRKRPASHGRARVGTCISPMSYEGSQLCRLGTGACLCQGRREAMLWLGDPAGGGGCGSSDEDKK